MEEQCEARRVVRKWENDAEQGERGGNESVRLEKCAAGVEKRRENESAK
ncbi:MAG: hypothetical protein AAB296_07535 [Candidatus Desantisbacteria bacterium]